VTDLAQHPRALPLSIAMACKNAERTIERVMLSCTGLASEVIALDSGSTDRTVAIITEHGGTVAPITWQGHVRTKQLAIERCTQPWVLLLDADESIGSTLAESIRQVLTSGQTSCDGYALNRKVFYAGAFLHHAWQPEWRLRLFRRGTAHCQGVDPHDHIAMITPAGQTQPPLVGQLAGDLRHDSIADFPSFLARQCEYGRIMAEGMYRRDLERGVPRSLSGELVKMAGSPVVAFAKQLVLKQGFRDGYRGWLAAIAAAVGAAAKHAAMVERLATRPKS